MRRNYIHVRIGPGVDFGEVIPDLSASDVVGLVDYPGPGTASAVESQVEFGGIVAPSPGPLQGATGIKVGVDVDGPGTASAVESQVEFGGIIALGPGPLQGATGVDAGLDYTGLLDGATVTQATVDRTDIVGADLPNQAPVLAQTIPNQSVVNGFTATLNLDTYFDDPDGGGLSYAIVSGPVSGISASVSGSTLTITGTSVSTINPLTIEATDPGGLSVQGTLNVEVTSGAVTNALDGVTQQPDPAAYDTQVILNVQSSGSVVPAVRTQEGDPINTDTDGNGQLVIPAEYTYQDITLEVYDSTGSVPDVLTVSLNLDNSALSPASSGGGSFSYDQQDVPVDGVATVQAASGGAGSFSYDQSDVPTEGAVTPPDPATGGGGSFSYDQSDVPIEEVTPASGVAGSVTYAATNITYDIQRTIQPPLAPATSGGGSFSYDQQDVPVSTTVGAATGGAGSFTYDQTDVPTTP